MPGICGIFDTKGNVDTSGVFAEMVRRMRFDASYREEAHIASDAHVAIGRTTLGNIAPEPQPIKRHSYVAVMEGEVYDIGGTAVDAGMDVQSLLDRLAQGPESLRAVNGSFVCAVWDEERSELVLINDRFGMRPVYYTVVDGRVLFSSNLAALLADPAVSPTVSKLGLAQFLTYGHYLEETTSVESIKVLPAGCVARFGRGAASLEITQYWRASDERKFDYGSDEEWLEAIYQSCVNAVQRRVDKPGKLGIALSGGLDARTILGLIDRGQDPTTAICYSMRGSLDHRCSEQMARLTRSPYHHYELGTEFLSDYRRHLERMVLLTDGQYLSQCIVMPTLPLYREHGIDVLMRGHAGELMHMHKAYAYSMDEEGLSAETDAEIEGWLLKHLQAYMLDSVDGALLTPEYQSVLQSAPSQTLKAAIADCASPKPPVQTVWQLFITQRLRRETSLSMAKFSSTVDIRLPFLDNDFIDLLLEAPPRLKMGDDIQRYILGKRRPDFLNVVNANTGTLIGAPKVIQQFSSLKTRVLGKLGVPGYQPYERLGLWLKREIAPVVRDILLSDQCRDRGIFEADAIKRVVDGHLGGRANSTYLIMAMMIIELGQRHLNGEEGFSAGEDEPAREAA